MPVFEHEETGLILKGLIRTKPERELVITFSGKNSLGGTFSFSDMRLKSGDCRIGNHGSRIEITAKSNSGMERKMVWLDNGEKGRRRVNADSVQLKITSLVIADSATVGLINRLIQEDKVEA